MPPGGLNHPPLDDSSHFGELRREVAQGGRGLDDLQTADRVALLENVDRCFDGVVDVALGIDSAGDRQAHELHWRVSGLAGVRVRAPEHDAADLDAPDPSVAIKCADEGLTGELLR